MGRHGERKLLSRARERPALTLEGLRGGNTVREMRQKPVRKTVG